MDLNTKQATLALLGEMAGTTILVTAYSLGIQDYGMGTVMIYFMLVILLYPISGAHLNPAVTLGQQVSSGSVKDLRFVAVVVIAQLLGGLIAMTISMLFRGFGTIAFPTFQNPIPPIATALGTLPGQSNAALVVFFGSAFFTAFYVMVTLFSRTKADRTAFTVALPSAIALYFANLLTSVSAGGYNNPVVALVIDIQNKKYTLFSGNTAIPGAYEWAMIFGAIAGGLLAGIACMFLEKVTAKIKEDEMS